MPPQILLVDPSDEYRTILVSLLQSAGYGVESAGSADAALMRLRRNTPDLVMGEHPVRLASGEPLCGTMRSEPGLRDVPFLALTARAMPGEIEAAREAHPAGVLVKPVTLVQIMTAIVDLVGPPAAGGYQSAVRTEALPEPPVTS